jgi:uncharacterized Zn finger protein
MPRDRYEPDFWRRYPPSVPLAAEGGIATSKQRGAMAESWWSRRFTEVLESYGLGGRMQRGRRYARSGQVLSLEVGAGVIAAQVQGSRRTPYLVTVTWKEPTSAQWKRIDKAMRSKVGFVATLLTGEVPPELEDVFTAAGVSLFPTRWADLRASCNCPDWGDPCKHVAAVLYVFADQLDSDPWLALTFRGRSREEVLGALGSSRSDHRSEAPAEVAPWWPFAPGPLPPLPDSELIGETLADPDRPDAVLDGLESLEVEIRGVALSELIRPLYRDIVS